MKPPRERRQNPREMCSDFVQVAWPDQSGRRLSRVGVLEDVSPEGLCISLELPMPVGHTVSLHTKGLEGEARVCYCEVGDYGYLVGVEFLNGLTWERERWRPRHLLRA